MSHFHQKATLADVVRPPSRIAADLERGPMSKLVDCASGLRVSAFQRLIASSDAQSLDARTSGLSVRRRAGYRKTAATA